MIVKSYEIKKNKSNYLKNDFFLLYGENLGLKKDIRDLIKKEIKQTDKNIEILSLYENEILNDESNFYNLIYSGSLFSKKKLIIIYDVTDKIFNKISDVYEKYPENISLIFFSEILDKKSKLRNFFEKNKKVVCTPCYLDSEKDLIFIAEVELKKNNIILSREALNLIIEKSNSDRNSLRNEIEKIKSYSHTNKNIELDDIKSLINFSGDYKNDVLVNECLCGNISQYRKIISELYLSAVNQVFLLRILGNKIHRLLDIKTKQNKTDNIDNIINSIKPSIFWKEKPLVKKQLSIWTLEELKKITDDINQTETLCKKNPLISNSIFFNFLMNVCKKASNFS